MKANSLTQSAQAAAKAWKASNPDTITDFVIIRNGSAFGAPNLYSATELGAHEDLGAQIVGMHGDVYTVQKLEDHDCPVCKNQMPDRAAFDEWNHFNCIDDECGARLQLDGAGIPKGYEGEQIDTDSLASSTSKPGPGRDLVEA